MNRSYKSILVFLLLVLVSCATNFVRDPAPASLDSQYPSIETVCNGQRSLGNNGCSLQIGRETKTVNVEIETIGNFGTIQIVSTMCQIDQTYNYENDKSIVGTFRIPLEDFIGPEITEDHKCLLRIDMFSRYKNQAKQTQVIRGMFGYIYLRAYENALPGIAKIKNRKYSSGVSGVNIRANSLFANTEELVKLELMGSENGLIRIERCNGEPIIEEYEDVKSLSYSISDLLGEGRYGIGDFCVIQIRAKTADLDRDIVWTVMINIFDPNYIKLPIPSLIVDKEKAILSGSEFVTFTRIDDTMINDRSTKFKANEKELVLIRQYTIQGRSLLCWFKNKKMECMN